MKYVVINEQYPLLFCDAINHSDFKKMGKITSAGFVQINDPENPFVFGESVSLNMKPDREMDPFLIKIMLRN